MEAGERLKSGRIRRRHLPRKREVSELKHRYCTQNRIGNKSREHIAKYVNWGWAPSQSVLRCLVLSLSLSRRKNS